MTFRWATPSRWKDVERLFGKNGACGGCWCMAWRLERKAYVGGKGAGNRRVFRKLIADGRKPGVIAYLGREAVGWCAVAPRADYSYLARSRVLAPVDDAPVWSITCLFVARPHRRRGVSVALLRRTAELAIARGAGHVEGYPQQPSAAKTPDVFIWTGTPSAFRQAGFAEVARRSQSRPIMRFDA